MKLNTALFCFWHTTSLVLLADVAIGQRPDGLNKWSNIAKSDEGLVGSEYIQKLGEGLYKTSHPRIYNHRDREDVHLELRAALTAIPGHAKYYRDQINEARGWVDDAYAKGVGLGPARAELSTRQMYAFQTLSLLPSPETVEVLGEFLYDDRGTPRDMESLQSMITSDGILLELPNNARAAAALEALIDDPPYPAKGVIHDADLEIWQLWYEQVKSGNRTFRFKGDPQQYRLERTLVEGNGNLDSGRRSVLRPESSLAAESGRTDDDSSVMIWVVLGGIVALGAGGWFWWRQRQIPPIA